MNTKPRCGPSVEKIPEGDNRPRLVCPDCGYVAYSNPKIVVGAVCTWDNEVLLCRRAIAPARGLWTIPAGFMEVGETSAEGAVREVWEEARARVRIAGLIGIYEIPHISQVNIIYYAPMTGPEIAVGEESEVVRLFAWADVPWSDLAFASVRWSLERFRAGPASWQAAAPEVHPRQPS